MDKAQVLKILEANANKSFVKRILEPNRYPSLDLGDGRRGTHLMAWGEANGKYVVFPTILYDGKGKLTKHDPDEAWRQVQQTGNFLEFNETSLFLPSPKSLF